MPFLPYRFSNPMYKRSLMVPFNEFEEFFMRETLHSARDRDVYGKMGKADK